MADAVGLSALGYYLPARTVTVEALVGAGKTNSSVESLLALGYRQAFVARDDESSLDMALSAIRDLERRSGFDLSRVNLMLHGTSLASGAIVDPGDDYRWSQARETAPQLKFASTRLQHELGLPQMPTMGISQLACSSFQGCLRVARALCLTEPHIEHVLCVSADRYPAAANREVVYALMSDGAAAAVVSRGASRHRILSASQITRGSFWDVDVRHDELVAAYFPFARQAVLEALSLAGLTVADIDLFIPNNISMQSWDLLAKLLRLPREKMYTDNIGRAGHAISADNMLNYVDVLDRGLVEPGDIVALFAAGFGAHWGCIILEA